MSRLLIRSRDVVDGDHRLMAITPASAGWRYVGFEVVRLARGEELRLDSADRELCLVVLGGSCSVRTADHSWEDLGERASVFDGPPAAVYLAPRTVATVSGRSDVEIAMGGTRATRGAETRVLRPAEARLEIRGTGVTERRIHHILMEDQPAEALLVTEVVTPAGHWSSFPPHKHDADDPPRETALEETYYHRLRDPRGFALQRVYTADRSLDESITVRNGDLVLVPRGYHTVSAAPGYELYYLNVMAGPVRRWCITFDPEHAWLRT